MEPGMAFIWLALAATLFSAWYYFKAEIGSNETPGKAAQKISSTTSLKLARLGFWIMTFFVILASIELFYLLLTHQFQVEYVYRYSSSDLPLGLLLSAFWAGQEGSFLLWALFTALLGIVFLKTARQYEGWGMFFFNIVQGFFLLILIKASPFSLLPQAPAEGAGLNPLLQNFWMVIHPPILFLGYAAATFPLLIALAALVKRQYDKWISQALPWTLFTAVTLGAGIIIGAFWAYEVLGWGGYWGWDPVENSSLIPWLTSLALLHGLVVERTQKLLKRTNLLLAIITFVLVIYATFLTRSGVLSDFSVHSFQNLGINAFLILFLLAILVPGLGLFLKRLKEIPSTPNKITTINRENGLILSLYLFLGSALFTFLGTSSPILTGILGNPSQVHISYYNKVNLPFGIAMAFILGIVPFLMWTKKNGNLLRKLLIPGTLAVISMASAFYMGLHSFSLVLFIGSAVFAFATNGIVLFQKWRNSWQNTGAPLAHLGLGMMFVGIVVSGTFAKKEIVALNPDKPLTVLGHQFLYKGVTHQSDHKDIINIQVSSGNSEYTATPRLYFSRYSQGMMHEPYVERGVLQDLYISPLERKQIAGVNSGSTIVLKKGEKQQVGGYLIQFERFEMGSHSDGTGMKVAAILDITVHGNTFTVAPAMVFKGDYRESEPVNLPVKAGNDGTHPTVILSQINADEGSVELVLKSFATTESAADAPTEQLIVEISKKPFMNVLWLGAVLIVLGTGIALQRRLNEKSGSE